MALIGFALLCGSCSNQQQVKVADPTKPQKLVLSTKPGQGDGVVRLRLRISGEINGNATVSGAPISTKHLQGHFEISYDGDYYSTNVVLEYQPQGVSTGRVVIDYLFKSL